MHDEAFAFVKEMVGEYGPWSSVVEFGGRNVNGSVRDLFATDDYRALDIAPGDGVDIVADCAEWQPDREVACVVCCEVFEHTPRWPEIVRTAHKALPVSGTLIVTAAADPRAPHSAIDGGPIRLGEWYENVDPDRLREVVSELGFSGRLRVHPRGDVYLFATKER